MDLRRVVYVFMQRYTRVANSQDYNQILLNAKDWKLLIVSCTPGRSLLFTVALFMYFIIQLLDSIA